MSDDYELITGSLLETPETPAEPPATQDRPDIHRPGKGGWRGGGAPKKGAIADRTNKKFPNGKKVAKTLDVYQTGVGIINEQIVRLEAKSKTNQLDFSEIRSLSELMKLQHLIENKETPGSNQAATEEDLRAAMKLLSETEQTRFATADKPEAESDEYSDLTNKKF